MREMLSSVRQSMMEANVALAKEAEQARAERDAALAETARVTALFESCIPPTAEEWFTGSGIPLDALWGIGWDSCRQKMVELLKETR